MHLRTLSQSDFESCSMEDTGACEDAASAVVFTLERVPALAEIGAMWRELETRADASFFQSWDWIGCWLEEAQIQPWALVGRLSKRIVALGLLQPSRRHRHLVVTADALLLHHLGERDKDALTIVYNGLLTDRGCGWQIVRRAIEFLFSRGPAMIDREGFVFDELHLQGVPELYARHARISGIRQVLMSKQRSWNVDLNKLRASGKSYLESLSANTRYQIRRAAKLYGARGRVVAKHADNLQEALTFYEAMKKESTAYWSRRGKTGSFSYPFFDRFHTRLVSECIPKGTVEVVRLTSGDRVIGYLYNFIYRGWVYAYQCAFVFENDPKYKPGLLAHALCIEQHLKNGSALYDFLPGYSRYKSNLGTPGIEMLDIVLQRPTATLTLEHCF